MKKLFIIASCVLVSGCAFNSQKAHITPNVSVMASSQGASVNLAVRVVDERPTQSLGHRGSAYGQAAEITSADDIQALVEREVMSGLKKKGFQVASYSETADPRLTVEVRLLDYSTSIGFWTGGVQIQAALKAIAFKNGISIDKMYRSSKEERVVVVPTAETNQTWISERLTDVLNQLLNDPALLDFLTKKSG